MTSRLPQGGFNLPPGVSIGDLEDQCNGTRELRGSPPIFEAGARVRIAEHLVRDPGAKVTDFVGLEGIVRFMVPNEYGEPAEWCAVFFPHRAGTSIWHADALQLVNETK